VIVPKKKLQSGTQKGFRQVTHGELVASSPACAINLDRHISFQIVVLSAYKQIRAQSENVLVDVGEDNFDRAFAQIRPCKLGICELLIVTVDLGCLQ
jgi:hypothetical protein